MNELLERLQALDPRQTEIVGNLGACRRNRSLRFPDAGRRLEQHRPMPRGEEVSAREEAGADAFRDDRLDDRHRVTVPRTCASRGQALF